MRTFAHLQCAGIISGMDLPDWMLVQRQQKGSYRSSDVVTFLDWVLPEALSPKDSIVVMLDWFAAHLSEEVAGVVREKGHVLLHHGGGVTGIEQINAPWPDWCCVRPVLHAVRTCAGAYRRTNSPTYVCVPCALRQAACVGSYSCGGHWPLRVYVRTYVRAYKHARGPPAHAHRQHARSSTRRVRRGVRTGAHARVLTRVGIVSASWRRWWRL